MTDRITSVLVAAGIAVMIVAFGVSGALASEVGGTLSSGGTQQGAGSDAGAGQGGDQSSSGGSMGGTVVGGSDGGSAGAAPTSVASRSGGNHSRIMSSDTGSTAIQSDGSLATASDYNGTGGGYDSDLDRYLASVGSAASNSLLPQDAVAYNGAVNPRALENAAAAAGGGSSTAGKAMATALVGLAVVGLAGYAVNSYLAYKRERGF